MNSLQLKPLHFASVSGGKDSLYMLAHILHNLDRYPLDGVVHYELEIDYPWVTDVINYMEIECKKYNIPFYRVKPSVSWYELYEKYGFPKRQYRWCNSKYKLDCERQLRKFLKTKGFEPIYYIGFCADEIKRFKDDNNIYPLAELGIYESTILEWAKNQNIFNNFYVFNKRQGCMFCPMSSMASLAYLAVFYRDKFDILMKLCKEDEKRTNVNVFQANPKYNTDYIENRVITHYVPKLLEQIKKGEET